MQINEHGCAPIKLYLQNQVVAQMGPRASVPTSGLNHMNQLIKSINPLLKAYVNKSSYLPLQKI